MIIMYCITLYNPLKSHHVVASFMRDVRVASLRLSEAIALSSLCGKNRQKIYRGHRSDSRFSSKTIPLSPSDFSGACAYIDVITVELCTDLFCIFIDISIMKFYDLA